MVSRAEHEELRQRLVRLEAAHLRLADDLDAFFRPRPTEVTRHVPKSETLPVARDCDEWVAREYARKTGDHGPLLAIREKAKAAREAEARARYERESAARASGHRTREIFDTPRPD